MIPSPAPHVIRGFLRTFGYGGITLPPLGIYVLLRHERKHLEQIERDGRVVFSIKYLWWLARHGYWNNPYEIQARAAEEEPS